MADSGTGSEGDADAEDGSIDTDTGGGPTDDGPGGGPTESVAGSEPEDTGEVVGTDPGDDDPVLETRDVRVVRGNRAVLDGVDLAIEPRTRLLVRGESGAGKTTLFNVLGLLEPPTAGVVRVDGRDASDLPERERARVRRDRVGVVYQEFRLIPDLTARENATLPRVHAGERDPAWIDELFDRLGIAHASDRYPATLSGGEKQRVAIARALANRPAVVLADEPTGQLDPETADRVLDLLLDLQADTGAALVVVSHDPAMAEDFERVVRIEDGRLVEDDRSDPDDTDA